MSTVIGLAVALGPVAAIVAAIVVAAAALRAPSVPPGPITRRYPPEVR